PPSPVRSWSSPCQSGERSEFAVSGGVAVPADPEATPTPGASPPGHGRPLSGVVAGRVGQQAEAVQGVVGAAVFAAAADLEVLGVHGGGGRVGVDVEEPVGVAGDVLDDVAGVDGQVGAEPVVAAFVVVAEAAVGDVGAANDRADADEPEVGAEHVGAELSDTGDTATVGGGALTGEDPPVEVDGDFDLT